MATPGESRLFNARVSLTQEMVKRLWAAYETFNGVRSDGGRPSGGLRDFTRTFMDECKKESNWGAYVRTMINLGAQGSIDAFIKAAQYSKSDTTTSKSIRALSKKSQNKIDELRKPKEKEPKPQEIIDFEISVLQNVVADCAAALEYLSGQGSEYPFAELKKSSSEVGAYWYFQLVGQATAHILGYQNKKLKETTKAIMRKLEIKAWVKSSEDRENYYRNYRKFFVDSENKGKIRGHGGRLKGRFLAEKYYKWLLENGANLVSWRDPSITLKDFDEAAKSLLEKTKRRFYVIAISELFRLNPELALLDSIHGDFDEKFAVRIKGKLMPEDFVNLPGYTEPEAVFHSRGIVFSGPQTAPTGYPKVNIRGGSGLGDHLDGLPSVNLLLPLPDGGNEEVQVHFHPDKRFRRFKGFGRRVVVEQQKKNRLKRKEVGPFKATYLDPHTKAHRSAWFQGIRLRFVDPKFDTHGEIQSADVYFDFVVSLMQQPQSQNAKAAEWIKPKKSKKDDLSHLQLAAGTKVGVVVYDIQNIAWVTVGTWDGNKFLCDKQHGGRTRLIAPLANLEKEIVKTQRNLRLTKKRGGGFQKGQAFAFGLHERLQHLRDEKIRKGAADVFHFLLGKDVLVKRQSTRGAGSKTEQTGTIHVRSHLGKTVDVVVVSAPEYLKVFGGRRDNNSRASFAAMTLHEQIIRSCMDHGIKVIEPKRFGYDRICRFCGHLGLRYYISRPKAGGKKLVFSSQGEQFKCTNPECAKCCDARHNAGIQLLKACVDPAILKPYNGYRELTKSQQETWQAGVEEQAREIILSALGL